jgi:hypothetical protein
MPAPEISVDITERDDGWLATVTVREGGSSTTHAVTVTRPALDRLAPGADIAALVRASFEFLLEREPKESILRSFEIEVIGHYFPEYAEVISRRLG